MRRLVRTYDKRLTLDEAEQISRITVMFNLVALVFLGLFALIAHLSYDRRYAMLLLGVMSLSVGNIALFILNGRMQMLVLMTCGGYLLFCLFLQISGGQNNSGILWHFVYPIMVYYIAGLRLGALFAGTLIVLETILMLMDDAAFFRAYYSFEFKLRFLSSMAVTSIMGAMLEHSRSTAQKNLTTLAQRLERASHTDELTSLPNRRALQETLKHEADRTRRGSSNFTVVLCDIDHFKKVNDCCGHGVGDEALRHLASIFAETIRQNDTIARWGGEEFMLIMPETDLAAGMTAAERIRAAVEATPLHASNGETLALTVSCGVASWSEHPELKQLFRVADNRLYRAKTEGRNRVVGLG
jgi:diguanylate cyclase (GGDEF)-like protein